MRAVKRDLLVASLLISVWCVSAGLAWRFVFRATIMSIQNQPVRSALGILGLVLALLVLYIPVNVLHHRLGASGQFLSWALEVFNRAIRGK